MSAIDGLDLEGQHVVLRRLAMAPQFRAIVERVVLTRGGFGCSPTAMAGPRWPVVSASITPCCGTAVFVTYLVDGEDSRVSRGDVERLATPEEVAEAQAEAERRRAS